MPNETSFLPTEIPMILYCPECRTRHIDKGDYATWYVRQWKMWKRTGNPFRLHGIRLMYCFHCCGWGNEPAGGYECHVCKGQGYRSKR